MTAREAIEYALAKARLAKEVQSEPIPAYDDGSKWKFIPTKDADDTQNANATATTAAAQGAQTQGNMSATDLAEHDKRFHGGAYKGGKCKFREQHGIETQPLPEGAKVESTGDGEENITQEEANVETLDKNKQGEVKGANAQNQTDAQTQGGDGNGNGGDDGGNANVEQNTASEIADKVEEALKNGVDDSELAPEEEVIEEDTKHKDDVPTQASQNQTDAQTQGGEANANADAQQQTQGGTGGSNDGTDADNIDGDELNAWETNEGYSPDTALPPESARPRHMAQIDRMVAKEIPALKEAGLADNFTADDVKKEYDAILGEIKAWEGSDDHEVIPDIRKKRDEIFDGLADKKSPQSIDISTGKPVTFNDGFGVTFHTLSCEEQGNPLYLDDAAYDKRTALFSSLAKGQPQVGVYDGEKEVSFRCPDAKRAIALCVMFEQKATFNYATFMDVRNTKFNRGVNALKRHTAQELAL